MRRVLAYIIVRGAVLAVGIAAGMLLSSIPVRAHEAPSGWTYPIQCCSNADCREVDGPQASERKSSVQVRYDEERNEYVISTTGERIGQLGVDARVKMSPDGAFHWCSQKGKDDTPTICLFVPPPLF